ncbi:hemerythrin domain-containing protein [Streptomyces sp. GLT-R25]
MRIRSRIYSRIRGQTRIRRHSRGHSHSSQSQPDDIGGILIHRGLREELSRLADAAESGRRAEAVQEQIELVIAVLHQHHHGEDEKLHPLVRDREPSIATILDELEKEHTLIQKLADDAADRTRPLPERAPVIRELLDVLRPHLALEEAEVFPAITRQVSQAEFEEFIKGELKAAGRRLPALFGMLLHYALPGERTNASSRMCPRRSRSSGRRSGGGDTSGGWRGCMGERGP